MVWLRIAVLIFLVVHGMGHSIWFIGAWVPQAKLVADGGWILPGGVSISDPVGKLFGLLALVAMVGFLVSAWALFQQLDWWRPTLASSAVVSLVAVIPWWSVSPGTTALNATAANVILLVFLLLPWSNDILTA